MTSRYGFKRQRERAAELPKVASYTGVTEKDVLDSYEVAHDDAMEFEACMNAVESEAEAAAERVTKTAQQKIP